MFKDVLKQLRKSKNMTQEELAHKLGIARTTYSSYEQGRREPDYETLLLIADFFDTSVDALLGRKEVGTVATHVNPELTEEEQEDVDKYIDFIISQRKDGKIK